MLILELISFFWKYSNPVGQAGWKVLLKPSQYAVDSVWGKEIQKNGFPFDARGLTGAFTEKYWRKCSH